MDVTPHSRINALVGLRTGMNRWGGTLVVVCLHTLTHLNTFRSFMVPYIISLYEVNTFRLFTSVLRLWTVLGNVMFTVIF